MDDVGENKRLCFRSNLVGCCCVIVKKHSEQMASDICTVIIANCLFWSTGEVRSSYLPASQHNVWCKAVGIHWLSCTVLHPVSPSSSAQASSSTRDHQCIESSNDGRPSISSGKSWTTRNQRTWAIRWVPTARRGLAALAVTLTAWPAAAAGSRAGG